MATEPTLTIAFTGGRFVNGQMPTDFLPDITALGIALREAAKEQYRTRTQRNRVPVGFADEVSTAISAVSTGSTNVTISTIQKPTPEGETPPLLSPYGEDIAKGWEQVVLELAQSHNGDSRRPTWAGLLRRFGLHFTEGEAARLSANGYIATYDRQTRRAYLRTRFPDEHYTEWNAIDGYIHARDINAGNFGITVDGEHTITAQAPQLWRSEIDRAFTLRMNGINATVSLVGEVTYDARGQPTAVANISETCVNHPLDISRQIRRLAGLSEGWLDGKSQGKAIATDHLDWLQNILEDDIHLSDATLPRLFPTPEGNILAEWHIGNAAASLEIDCATGKATWEHSPMPAGVSGTTDEHPLNLNSADDCRWLNESLKIMAAEVQQ